MIFYIRGKGDLSFFKNYTKPPNTGIPKQLKGADYDDTKICIEN